jgi:hypothetical protein
MVSLAARLLIALATVAILDGASAAIMCDGTDGLTGFLIAASGAEGELYANSLNVGVFGCQDPCE